MKKALLFFIVIFSFILTCFGRIQPVSLDLVQPSVKEVEIKGEVKKPGVYQVKWDANMQDQTTPNMIQRISGIFERNPLISKEI